MKQVKWIGNFSQKRKKWVGFYMEFVKGYQ